MQDVVRALRAQGWAWKRVESELSNSSRLSVEQAIEEVKIEEANAAEAATRSSPRRRARKPASKQQGASHATPVRFGRSVPVVAGTLIV